MKDWAAAAAALDRLLAEFPDSPYRREALYLRAESALQHGDAAAAESGFATLLKEPAAASDPKGLVRGVRVKQIQCWVALKRWKDALEGAAALKAGLPPGDPSTAELTFASGQALLGLARLERGARGVSERRGCPRRQRSGGTSAIDARRNLLPPGPIPRGTPRFPQGRYPLRRTALAGRRTARSGKSL